MNTPGDPFETDGVNWDPAQVTSPDSGLMNGVQTMRNRYFWHSAEFARTASGIPLLVKLGLNYTKFEVPPHETVAPETATTVPRRSYVYWPIQDKVDDTAGSRSQYDLLLYAMGEDRFIKHLIPNGPFEGTLVVVVKMLFTFDATFAPSVGTILPALRNRIRADHGSKFYAVGKVRVGTPQEWEFKKCLIRFSPRFIVPRRTALPHQREQRCAGEHAVDRGSAEPQPDPGSRRFEPERAECAPGRVQRSVRRDARLRQRGRGDGGLSQTVRAEGDYHRGRCQNVLRRASRRSCCASPARSGRRRRRGRDQ